ncbi:MAG TPA: dethiobiotin synthase [Gemmatimonadaceae bacterium]|jgi:dethiobiotin synthetase
MIRLGVTGTDTGIGKTVVACALASALTRRGMRVAAMKPVETGCEFSDPARDGARLARAAAETRDLSVVAPLVFPEPVAPVLAAELAGSAIDVAALDGAVEKASRGYDALIVEGAGGLLVPVTNDAAYDKLFARWSLDVVIVAANRLGVINHTRLTIAAARAAGLRVRAVVLNQVADAGGDRSTSHNLRLIHDLEHVPVVELPRMPAVDDLALVATIAERSGLVDLIVADAD